MKRIHDVLIELNHHLDQHALEDFIARGWVRPTRDQTDYVFDEIDISRVHLICELRIDMKFEIDAIDIILSLMDQLYENKNCLNKIIDVLENQPSDIRESIIENLNNRP